MLINIKIQADCYLSLLTQIIFIFLWSDSKSLRPEYCDEWYQSMFLNGGGIIFFIEIILTNVILQIFFDGFLKFILS